MARNRAELKMSVKRSKLAVLSTKLLKNFLKVSVVLLLLSLSMLSCMFFILKRHIIWFQYYTKLAISQEKSRGHCSYIDKYCMTAERSVAVIKTNGKFGISNRERGIIRSKATQIIYCRRLDLDHLETLMFNGCVLTSYFRFGCRLQNVSSFFFFLEMHCL